MYCKSLRYAHLWSIAQPQTPVFWMLFKVSSHLSLQNVCKQKTDIAIEICRTEFIFFCLFFDFLISNWLHLPVKKLHILKVTSVCAVHSNIVDNGPFRCKMSLSLRHCDHTFTPRVHQNKGILLKIIYILQPETVFTQSKVILSLPGLMFPQTWGNKRWRNTFMCCLPDCNQSNNKHCTSRCHCTCRQFDTSVYCLQHRESF